MNRGVLRVDRGRGGVRKAFARAKMALLKICKALLGV